MKTDNSKKLYSDYKKYIFKVSPFRTPIIRSGRGSFVEDMDGNKYLDMLSGQFCLPLGYANEEFNKLVKNQLEKIIHTNTLFLTEEVLRGLKELASITAENLNKGILLSTGAEAVECALRYAKFFTNKEGIVGISKGYHGLTLATQSISSNGQYAKPRVSKTFSIPTPDFVKEGGVQSEKDYINSCLKKTKKILEPHGNEIAAFVLEPVLSVGGMIFPPKEYFQGIKKIAKELSALIILDECQTGLGRIGKWFCYENIGVIPDILVTAKSLGVGLASSAVVVNDEIAKKVEDRFIHFSSHQNDPISGAVLEFLVTYIKKNNLLKSINENGKYLLEKLEEISKENSWLINPRGIGLMLAFDLPQDKFNLNKNPGLDLISIMEKNGVFIQAIAGGKTFRILPSYTINKQEIDVFANILQKSLKELK